MSMEYTLIILLLYGALFLVDILPSIKKKRGKPLKFSIPVYLITLVMNIMIGFGFKFPSPIKAIESVVNMIFPQK